MEKNNDIKNEIRNIFQLPFIGILAVDLSPKMLQKSKLKNCYGDMIVSDVMLFVQEYAENVRAISKIDTESKGRNDNTNDNNVFEVEKEDNEVENEVEKEVESSSHPLLDFITAADVFMYLGDVTYCTVLQ